MISFSLIPNLFRYGRLVGSGTYTQGWKILIFLSDKFFFRFLTFLQRWGRQQGQRSLYVMERGFYGLSHEGPADRALPVKVQPIKHLGEQARASTSQSLDVGDTKRSLPHDFNGWTRTTAGHVGSSTASRRISPSAEQKPKSTRRDTRPSNRA